MNWDTRWGGVFALLDPLVQGNANVPAVVQSLVHYVNKWQVQYWSHVPHDNSGDTNFIATDPGRVLVPDHLGLGPLQHRRPARGAGLPQELPEPTRRARCSATGPWGR